MKPLWAFVAGAIVATALTFALRDSGSKKEAAGKGATATAAATTDFKEVEVVPVEPRVVDKPVEPLPEIRPAKMEVARPVSRVAPDPPERRPAKKVQTRLPEPAPSTPPVAPEDKKPQTAQTQPAETPAPPPATPQTAGIERPPLPPPPPAEEPKAPEPRKAATVTIPAGTLVTVRLDETLSTAKNASGDSFRASLDQPLVADGFVIAERGSKVSGKIVTAHPGGRVQGVAQLVLELVSVRTADGQTLNVRTAEFTRNAESAKGNDAAKVAAAAGIGAVIGAIAGGGKGAAIGAGAGAAAGGGAVAMTRGKPAELSSETRISFKLADPVTVTEKL